MPTMLLIDGSSLLVTHYYGTAPIRDKNETDEEYYKKITQKDGVYTNGVTSALRTIANIVDKVDPDYIAVALDVSRKDTFRTKLYPDYKGNRGQTPAPLKQEMESFRAVLEKLKIPVLRATKYEADDLVGALVTTFHKEEGLRIAVMTKDRDYYQLAKDNVEIWQPQASKEKAKEMFTEFRCSSRMLFDHEYPYKVFAHTPSTIKQETGVYPNQIPDLKGIQGDKSDNIPGIKGVSSAAPILLSEFQTLDGIYEALETNEESFSLKCKELGIKRSPVKALKEHKEEAFLSRSLATMAKIKTTNPLSFYEIKTNPKIINETEQLFANKPLSIIELDKVHNETLTK